MTQLNLAINAAIKAGKEILMVYQTDFDVDYKEDASPLTLADMKANAIICQMLEGTNIPILSEEGKHLPYSVRKNWDTLWIVDPLDGTKEFVKKNGEFTVNIALIKNNQPILGVIFCPILKILYFADQFLGGAYKIEISSSDYESTYYAEELIKKAHKLPLILDNKSMVIAASRSHLSEETKDFVNRIKEDAGEIEFVSKGSSLKLCMIAEGSADIYPRFAPTSEWDTAAGQAIVEFAGGKVLNYQSLKPMVYNKEDILNPWFVAVRKGFTNKIKL